jgi:type IV secretory pathway VirJ component
MLMRNGFSMLAVALVDFHDAMELALDAANAKNSSKVIELYLPISEKLKAIEADSNDAEIQSIRRHLDALLALANEAKNDQLPAQGEALKSSFVKVYLKRG